MSPVLFQPQPSDEKVVYEVRRGKPLNNPKIRYDQTAIFPGKIGRELPKTFGHYHPKKFPEIFEVISGQVWWLLQRPKRQNPKAIDEIYLVEALAREKAIMLPGFGFVSINPGEKKLVMANWVSSEFENDYETYENLRGAAYYVLESSDGKSVDFEKNSYYEKVPEITKLRPKEIPELGILKSRPLYEMIKIPKSLEFLTKPEKYLNLLTVENCFKRI